MDELEDKEQNLTTKGLYDYKLVVAALQNSDQKAYAELLHRYRDSIFFMMLKMCNNKDDAEDLTIEAFGRAFKKLDQYSPDFAFSTWLFKIATNNAIDFIRKKKKNYSVSLDHKSDNSEFTDHSANIKSTTPDPEEAFIKKQKMEEIQLLVESLKPRYKSMIEMFYFQEMTHEEISVKLNMPLGTIKAQLFRARDLLYSALKRREENP
ncbi:MAG TPA: sigma-70 family RNA polymerase sigma factor [Bacteroidia bacterium]|nr:sigma-70 family RNA polymerase sigma factor [Bacteroidia bacterium]